MKLIYCRLILGYDLCFIGFEIIFFDFKLLDIFLVLIMEGFVILKKNLEYEKIDI